MLTLSLYTKSNAYFILNSSLYSIRIIQSLKFYKYMVFPISIQNDDVEKSLSYNPDSTGNLLLDLGPFSLPHFKRVS